MLVVRIGSVIVESDMFGFDVQEEELGLQERALYDGTMRIVHFRSYSSRRAESDRSGLADANEVVVLVKPRYECGCNRYPKTSMSIFSLVRHCSPIILMR